MASKRWLSLLVVPLALSACGRADSVDDATQQQIQSAEAVAQRAIDEVRNFEARVSLLERRVAAQRRAGESFRTKSQEVNRALRRLDAKLAKLEESDRSAAQEARSALARAEAAVRDLAILTRRFDYHLQKGN